METLSIVFSRIGILTIVMISAIIILAMTIMNHEYIIISAIITIIVIIILTILKIKCIIIIISIYMYVYIYIYIYIYI